MTSEEVDGFHLFVACGSYDGSVFGLNCEVFPESDDASVMKTLFVDPDAHNGSIKCIDASGVLCISGGTDDTIQVYSFSEQSKLGCLELHSAPVKCLSFINGLKADLGEPSHILSGSDDCSLILWRTDFTMKDNWECIRQMKRHKGTIKCISTHPTNRLCVTLGDDHTIRIWNLMRGRQAYVMNVKSEEQIESVSFTQCGTNLFVTYLNKFDLIKIIPDSDGVPIGGKLASVEFDKPFTADPKVFMETSKSTVIVTGMMRNLKFYRCDNVLSDNKLNEVTEICSTVLPGRRIKNIKVLRFPNDTSKRLLVVSSTDADGSFVRVYRVKLEEDGKTDLSKKEHFCLVSTLDVPTARITSMSACWFNDDKALASGVFNEILDATELVTPNEQCNQSDTSSEEEEDSASDRNIPHHVNIYCK